MRKVVLRLFQADNQVRNFWKSEDDMSKTFGGKTSDAGAPILGSRAWEEGMKIDGVVIRSFATANGECYEVKLTKALRIDGEKVYPPMNGEQVLDKVSIGSMKGFMMALAAAGLDRLEPRDRITIQCIGFSSTGKGNDRVDFEVSVVRP